MKKNDCSFLDRVILHNKNADERLFDLILRFITFVLLIIIIWIYADLTHVKAAGLTLAQYYNIDFEKLLYNNTNSLLWTSEEYVNALNEYTNINYDSNYHPNFIATSYVTNRELPDEFIIDDCYAFYCWASSGLNGWYVFYIPKSLIDSHQVIYTQYGFYALNDFTFYSGSIWNGSTVYAPDSFTFSSSGGVHHMSVDQYCSTANCYFSNCPCWTGTSLDSNSIGGPINWGGVIDRLSVNNFIDSDSLFNCNYFLYDGILSNPWGNDEELRESNANHLYLNDIQVGLSCDSKGQDLRSSNVLIGVDFDDWISNHVNEFQLRVKYTFDFSGYWNNVASPYNGSYSTIQFANISTFKNGIYSYGISEIANDSGFPYNNLASMECRVTSQSEPYLGLFPNIYQTTQRYISNWYQCIYPLASSNIRIENYTLTVECSLYSGLDYGGTYVKEFDFLTGSESVKRADILNNNNPWLGDPEPQLPSNVPEGNINYGSGSNNNFNVQVYSEHKVPMNVQNRQELQDTLNNYNEATETFINTFRSFADSNNQNNFLYMISDTYGHLPGVNYIVSSCIIVFGLAIILFILKVLLF